ncbi:YbjN domain-containing protein [Pontibacter chinhatensis]|uniref:Putative sensory transduction regulator n=1 Tax=Pontibacter chinhatensis TaxID=1436961 RepID=A0A1I2Z413_9BACT|nr:YbjN domain-containing protein [Pontibacter chinhatensis]SFH32289.1 Putative sensory transduction regulator [Pontibacter chinhatensis]
MVNNYFQKVRSFLLELDFQIMHEDEQERVFVVEKESLGIKNLVIGCTDPLLIIEQYLLELPTQTTEIYRSLLQKNRDIIHGAFVLDDTGRRVIFRDTLQMETLDLCEIEATFNSLALLLSEYSDQLIQFSKN